MLLNFRFWHSFKFLILA